MRFFKRRTLNANFILTGCKLKRLYDRGETRIFISALCGTLLVLICSKGVWAADKVPGTIKKSRTWYEFFGECKNSIFKKRLNLNMVNVALPAIAGVVTAYFLLVLLKGILLELKLAEEYIEYLQKTMKICDSDFHRLTGWKAL